jgi:hypothetical protein
MSNYSDPEAVRPPVAIGPCRCPGKPHDTDYATIVQRLGYGDIGMTRQVMQRKGIEAYYQALILVAVKAWTLVLPNGKPRPIDPEQVALLDEWTVNRLIEDDLIGAALMDEDESPPSGSGAPSQSGTQESAPASTPTDPEPAASTTS